MAGLIVKNRLQLHQLRAVVQLSVRASHVPVPLTKVDIGTREVVGHGASGELTYIDSLMDPFPAIRFKEDKGDIVGLRTKEKGDWKKLTIEEKKALYRASFCQTMAEIDAPTGEWKSVLAITIMGVCISVILYLWTVVYVYDSLPITVTDEERVKAQIDRMIAMRNGPIGGIASKYDYEQGRWKE